MGEWAPHEYFELQDLINFKHLCAVKWAAMAGLAKDEELRAILLTEAETAQKHFLELKDLMGEAPLKKGHRAGGMRDGGVRS